MTVKDRMPVILTKGINNMNIAAIDVPVASFLSFSVIDFLCRERKILENSLGDDSAGLFVTYLLSQLYNFIIPLLTKQKM